MRVRDFLRRDGDRLLAITLVAGIFLQTLPLAVEEALATVLAIVLAISLAWRRQAPLAVLGLGIATAAASLTAPVDAPVAVVISLVIATYSVGAHTTGRAAFAGALGVAVLIVVAVAKDLGADQEINDVAVPTLILGVPWLTGLSIRSRGER